MHANVDRFILHIDFVHNETQCLSALPGIGQRLRRMTFENINIKSSQEKLKKEAFFNIDAKHIIVMAEDMSAATYIIPFFRYVPARMNPADLVLTNNHRLPPCRPCLYYVGCFPVYTRFESVPVRKCEFITPVLFLSSAGSYHGTTSSSTSRAMSGKLEGFGPIHDEWLQQRSLSVFRVCWKYHTLRVPAVTLEPGPLT